MYSSRGLHVSEPIKRYDRKPERHDDTIRLKHDGGGIIAWRCVARGTVEGLRPDTIE